jgi:hypothetical protein
MYNFIVLLLNASMNNTLEEIDSVGRLSELHYFQQIAFDLLPY